MIRCPQFTWEFATQSKRFPRLQTNCDLFGFLFEEIHSRSPAGLLWSTYMSVTLVQYLMTSRSFRSAITNEAPGHSQKVTCDLFSSWRLHSRMVTNSWAYRRADPIQYTIGYSLRMNSRPEFCVLGFLKSRGPVYEFLMSGVQFLSCHVHVIIVQIVIINSNVIIWSVVIILVVRRAAISSREMLVWPTHGHTDMYGVNQGWANGEWHFH
jgi:hypothetical protein